MGGSGSEGGGGGDEGGGSEGGEGGGDDGGGGDGGAGSQVRAHDVQWFVPSPPGSQSPPGATFPDTSEPRFRQVICSSAHGAAAVL